MIKYRTGGWGHDKITPVKVLRETDKTIWVEVIDFRGKSITEQRRKDGKYSYSYHLTWQDAHKHLVVQQQQVISSIKAMLMSERDILCHLKAMQEPDSPSPACGEE